MMDYFFEEDYDENLVIKEPNPVYPDDDELPQKLNDSCRQ